MKRILYILIPLLALTACAPHKYHVVAAPKKTEEEKKVATKYANDIFAVYHSQGIEYMKQELEKPEFQQQLAEKISGKLDNSSLGDCLVQYGFDDYLIKRILKDVNAQSLRKQIIEGWIEQMPMDMLKKVDQTMTKPSFKKTFQRMRQMPGGNIKDKLNELRGEQFITEAEANEFILTIEDIDIKSFMIISQGDVKKASGKLLSSYINNPASVVLDFMQTHPEANNHCSMLKGSAL